MATTLTRTLNAYAAAGIGAALLAACTTPAAAQPRDFPGPGERFIQETLQILDLDGDGRISVPEIGDEQDRLVAAIDVNGDGVLSVDEFRRNGRLLLALNVATFFDMLDANGDRRLDAAEIKSPAQRWVSRYDANGDGGLDGDELRAARLGIGN